METTPYLYTFQSNQYVHVLVITNTMLITIKFSIPYQDITLYTSQLLVENISQQEKNQ